MMRFFRAFLGATALAALVIASPRASAAEGGESGKTSILPDWFNRQSTEYFTMPPFVVPVISGSSVDRQITLLVTLETKGVDNKEKIVQNRQRLQDAFLRDIYGVLSVDREDDRDYTDAVRIRLKRVGDRLLGPGVIGEVLVKTTYDRRVGPGR
jgi:hypothetical protein